MSLDVYLTTPRAETPRAKLAVDMLVKNGFEDFAYEIEARHDTRTYDTLYEANYTHNCGEMAELAGIYSAVWRPEENGITKASQLIPVLKAGIEEMESNPAKYEAKNPENGWGSYRTFLPWLRRYLCACQDFPDSDVSVSR
jgi:hypothetical protein